MRPTPDRDPRLNRTNKVLSYFSYLMVLVYFALGACLLFTDLILKDLPQIQRQILGGVLLLYAVYRGYSIYSRSKTYRNDDEA